MTYSKNWNEVEMMFRDKAFKYSNPNMLILKKRQALEFIEECKKRKIPIWGIDGFLVGKDIQPIKGFTITDKSIQPSQEDSIDFSRSPYNYTEFASDEIYTKSTEFIRGRLDRLYFEIGCDSTSEE